VQRKKSTCAATCLLDTVAVPELLNLSSALELPELPAFERPSQVRENLSARRQERGVDHAEIFCGFQRNLTVLIDHPARRGEPVYVAERYDPYGSAALLGERADGHVERRHRANRALERMLCVLFVFHTTAFFFLFGLLFNLSEIKV